tara:strand:+ start:3517 stop:3777 length:261 start_codon:yes stop_codon:yes gene_type:complete
MPQQAHIAYRVDVNTLINHPEKVLQSMSFKILEKRDTVIQNLIGTKIQFKTSNGCEQGICKEVHNNVCIIKVGNDELKVLMKKLIL